MATAKLSQSAAASLAFVKRLQNPETHSLVRREVFAQAKMNFGIPAEHKVRVELDPGQPGYLELVRKKDGSRYELGADNKWVGLAVDETPAAKRLAYVIVNMDDLQQWAIEMADNGNAFDVVDADYADNESDGDVSPVQIRGDGRYVYVKVDRSELSDD